MIIILYLSTGNAPQIPSPPLIGIDKLGHAFFYGILTILIIIRLKEASIFKDHQLKIAFIGAVAYGFLMEWMQWAFFPHRYFEFSDIFANIVGGLVGIVIYYFTQDKLNVWVHSN